VADRALGDVARAARAAGKRCETDPGTGPFERRMRGLSKKGPSNLDVNLDLDLDLDLGSWC
jgi:hypothetical protein